MVKYNKASNETVGVAHAVGTVDVSLPGTSNGPSCIALVNGSARTQQQNNILEDRRRNWTITEMEELMYCYFKAKAEGRGYLKKLEEYFKARNPDNPKVGKFTGNTLAAQCRHIEKTNVIGGRKLNAIKAEAEGTQNQDNSQTEPEDSHAQPKQQDEENNLGRRTKKNQRGNKKKEPEISEEEQTALIEAFQRNYIQTRSTKIEDRDALPKANLHKIFVQKLNVINTHIETSITQDTDLTEINNITYAAAKTLIEENGQKAIKSQNRKKKEQPWERRLQKKVEEKRTELARILSRSQGEHQGKRKKNKLQKIYQKYNINDEKDLPLVEEQLKQEIKATAGRLRRYKDNDAKKKQNQMFTENEKLFYRKYLSQQAKVEKIPQKEEIEEFWKKILENKPTIEANQDWIRSIEKKTARIEETSFSRLTIEKLEGVIKKAKNWKATGVDRVHNYYIKKLTATHVSMLNCFNRIIMENEEIPDWMTVGRVILLPKSEETENPKNWRPIACLPTVYKILTAAIAEEIREHCSKNNILTDFQRGCKKGARGCQDQLLLNRGVLDDAHKNSKNLSMAWIDYQKAFDSIPHEWLIKTMNMYKIPAKLVETISKFMKKWKLQMTAYGESEAVTTDPIQVKCGIFQGDSLSPLLFCIGLNPLSQVLAEDKINGYTTKGRKFINHLLYMDDIKVYAKNEKALDQLLKKIEVITNDIGMKFGLDKCKTIHLKRGKQQRTQGSGHILLSGEIMEELEPNQEYKYLGIKESGKINHGELKKTVSEEYVRRVRKILKTGLNSANIISAINRQAVPVLTYSFLVIKWKEKEIEGLDVKTRRMLTIHGCHQAKADKDRLYQKTDNGGRGLTCIKDLYVRATIGYAKYLNRKEDEVISKIRDMDKSNIKYSIIREADKYQQQLEIGDEDDVNKIKKKQEELCGERWQKKKMYGQFKNLIEEEFVDKKQSFIWTKKKTILPRIHAEIMAIQDQCIKTKYYAKRITKQGEEDKCRRCKSEPETIHHIAGGCGALAKKEYIERHDNIVKYVHWNIAKENSFEVPKQWWTWELKENAVLENEKAKILWEVPVRTDKKINANRPDVIFINKEEKMVYLIDVTIPQDYNIAKKELAKQEHYRDLKAEIGRLWKMKAQVVPVVIGCTGVVGKSLKKHVKKISNKISIDVMQKQAAIKTVSIVAKVLSID